MTDLSPIEFDILQACIRLGRFDWRELGTESGYPHSSIVVGMRGLRKFDLVANIDWKTEVTEKGKIVFAILSGKRARTRATKRRSA
jgi:hypothetical protein